MLSYWVAIKGGTQPTVLGESDVLQGQLLSPQADKTAYLAAAVKAPNFICFS